MSIDVRAHANYVPHSPQKVRLLVDLVRGKQVAEAQNILRFAPQAAATPLLKLINSAIANAEENFGLSAENLYIHTIYANEAPTRKWRKFGARGRFKPWLRRASHITVILREKE
ncbi:MAG: 50S ribosomal protein L22 [Anaerolineales bacterium]|nr:50S ribosomal protein L22 [Anaerolineales bacterium]MCS7249085.1 50S ribosomal protein L22 [Anaerolineales bacterium]MDW8162898.1 50S ribosomal protein L22 [Anaerolineales bacterium]MDW8445932.1 50S ribosomal protein L22 [Anaerolineales bacterium]